MPKKKEKSFQELLDEKWAAFLAAEKAKKYPNIMLIGKSGAGKSTLVNKVFGVDIAATSNVAPETKDFIFYDGHTFNRKINLIDSAGYELDQSEEYLNEILNAINQEYDGVRVNVIWYCIPLNRERIEPIDLRLIKELYDEDAIKGRLCVVFTQCDEDDEDNSREKAFKNVLRNQGMGTLTMFSVCTNDKAPHQLNELIKWSSGKIEEEDLRYSFISSQMQDLDLKKQEAQRIIDLACTETALSKLFDQINDKDRSDELAEYQIQMVTNIFGVYGIDCLEGISKSFEKGTGFSKLCSFVTDGIVTLISKKESLATEFVIKGFKLGIPVALTKGIGTLASRASYRYVKAHINGVPVKLEELYSDPKHAGFIKLIVQDFFDTMKEKTEKVDEENAEAQKNTREKKGKSSGGKKAKRNSKAK